ncbi:MAG: MFS transporter [bacterium]
MATADMFPGEPYPGLLRVQRGLKRYFYDIGRFSRNAKLYLAGSFLMAINMQVFLLLLNLYLKEAGFAESQIGLIVSSRSAGVSLLAIPAALLLSRVRLKPILVVACVLFAAFSFGIVWYRSLSMLVLFSLLAGGTFAFYRVAAGPFYMRNSTPVERTHLFSFSFGTMILAGMVGSLGAGKLATYIADLLNNTVFGYQYTIYVGITVSLLAVIPFLLIRASQPSAEENRVTLTPAQLKKRGRFYLKITSVNFAIGLGAGLIIPFLNLYFRDRFHLAPDAIGGCFFGVQLAMLIGSLAGPVLARKFGLVRAVVLTQLSSIPFLLILAYTYSLPLAIAAFVIRGGLMNIGVPIITNLGMELSQKQEQGLVNALLMVAWTSSRMVATALGGSMIEAYGYTVTMNITVILYVLSSLMFFRFFRHSENRATGFAVSQL